MARCQYILGFVEQNCIFDLIVAVLFALAGAGMVYNECHKRKCRHLDEVNRHQIP
ncbi:MAG: hypothetical protein ACLRMJ_12270 [Alistipes finegoldii]